MSTTLPLALSTDPIRAAMATINADGRGIALVTDPQGYLLGTITDGDIRRAVLAGVKLDAPAWDILEGKPVPVTAPVGMLERDVRALMHRKGIRQIPLIDILGRVVDLATMADSRPVQALVMAGGYGMRLRPLTDTTPKPMLPVNGRPLLEHTLERLRDAGIRRVTLATHYLPERISDHFGDGSGHGLDIDYLHEDQPLGTAGALRLLRRPAAVLLVVNGDVYSRCDYRALLAYHAEQGADLTVGVLRYELQVPYGVLATDGPRVTGMQEKPTVALSFNAGLYALERTAWEMVPEGGRYDMTELIAALLGAGRRVAAWPLLERWIDVGSPETYQAAQEGDE